MSEPKLFSKFYEINTTPQFDSSLKKNFAEHEINNVYDDIQTIFNRLDIIGKIQQKWKREHKRFIELKRTKKDFCLCKAYIPITSRMQNSINGARLYLAVQESVGEHQAVLIQIIPKSKIAKGSKKDLSKGDLKRMFTDYIEPGENF